MLQYYQNSQSSGKDITLSKQIFNLPSIGTIDDTTPTSQGTQRSDFPIGLPTEATYISKSTSTYCQAGVAAPTLDIPYSYVKSDYREEIGVITIPAKKKGLLFRELLSNKTKRQISAELFNKLKVLLKDLKELEPSFYKSLVKENGSVDVESLKALLAFAGASSFPDHLDIEKFFDDIEAIQ